MMAQGASSATTEFARTGIDVFRGASGKFTMVAIDQRDSLRRMLQPDESGVVDDARLIQFKVDVARVLSERGTGILLDRDYGTEAAFVADCPVILAVDVLSSSRPGGHIDTARIDEELAADTIERVGANALKMLVPWLPERREEAIDLSARFMDLSREIGLPGIVEGVVRPHDIDSWSSTRRADAIVQAAEDLASTQPDLYKGEVVYTGPEDRDVAVGAARAISAALSMPWVVLSAGVPSGLFADALACACEGGAEGFLAGRAIWGRSAGAADTRAALETDAVAALNTYIAIAEEASR